MQNNCADSDKNIDEFFCLNNFFFRQFMTELFFYQPILRKRLYRTLHPVQALCLMLPFQYENQ